MRPNTDVRIVIVTVCLALVFLGARSSMIAGCTRLQENLSDHSDEETVPYSGLMDAAQKQVPVKACIWRCDTLGPESILGKYEADIYTNMVLPGLDGGVSGLSLVLHSAGGKEVGAIWLRRDDESWLSVPQNATDGWSAGGYGQETNIRRNSSAAFDVMSCKVGLAKKTASAIQFLKTQLERRLKDAKCEQVSPRALVFIRGEGLCGILSGVQADPLFRLISDYVSKARELCAGDVAERVRLEESLRDSLVNSPAR